MLVDNLTFTFLPNTYPQLFNIFTDEVNLLDDRNIVVLSLSLGQKLEPSIRGALHDLTDAKAQGPHEVILGNPVPVPDLNEYSPLFVLRLEIP